MSVTMGFCLHGHVVTLLPCSDVVHVLRRVEYRNASHISEGWLVGVWFWSGQLGVSRAEAPPSQSGAKQPKPCG
jgi:hypothetical protein